ncbi:DUF4184 family protein [Streptomyces inhibens]|uniref:DUF4184 family protein n=1 Tax=Streptomyces inhibens TaxID=2293571 RepID=UPI00369CF8BD
MPFTLSHAAAVLPAIRRNGAARGPLVASALVAGSFAPDMTYYADTLVPGAMEFGEVTHSLFGVLTVDVLFTVALVGGWLLLREPLLELLPRAWRGRVRAFAHGRPWKPRGPRELAALAGGFLLSAVLGATTHVVWDAFTHPGRWGTRLIPGLDRTVAGFPVATYLQYGTSALALAGMGWFVWSALRGEGAGRGAGAGPAAPAAIPSLTVRQRLLVTAPLAVCVLLGALHRTLRAHAAYGDAATWFSYVPTVLFGAGAGLALGLPLYAVAVRLLHRHPRRIRAAGHGAPVQLPRPADRSASRTGSAPGAASASGATASASE